jgi:AAA domain
MKLTEKIHRVTQSVLVYGPPKVGKSQLVGELAATKKLIWFDLENGYSTLLKLPQSSQQNIEIISIPDTKSFPIAVETCLKVIKGGPIKICEEHGKVSCPQCAKDSKPSIEICLDSLDDSYVVVFDSLTQLVTSCISHITKGKPDDYRLEFGDYSNLGKLMEIFLSHIQQARYNVVCISHESEAELEDGKIKLVPVSGTRNASRNTAKYFGHVIYCEVKNKKHNFYSSTTSINNVSAGSRTGVAIENLEGSPLSAIFALPTSQVSKNNITETSKLQALLKK